MAGQRSRTWHANHAVLEFVLPAHPVRPSRSGACGIMCASSDATDRSLSGSHGLPCTTRTGIRIQGSLPHTAPHMTTHAHHTPQLPPRRATWARSRRRCGSPNARCRSPSLKMAKYTVIRASLDNHHRSAGAMLPPFIAEPCSAYDNVVVATISTIGTSYPASLWV
jgi:hypothetical protein